MYKVSYYSYKPGDSASLQRKLTTVFFEECVDEIGERITLVRSMSKHFGMYTVVCIKQVKNPVRVKLKPGRRTLTEMIMLYNNKKNAMKEERN